MGEITFRCNGIISPFQSRKGTLESTDFGNDFAAYHSAPSVNSLPLGATSFRTVRYLLPSFIGNPVTVITSPGFNESVRHPERYSRCGGADSATHFTMLPWSSFTSKVIRVWGFMNSYFVTVP